MSNWNDRSDAAMRERLKLAEKAVQEVGTTLWKDYQAALRELCILDAFNERILTMEDYTEVATARHIAASSPDVVQADIGEILRLRAENERLALENQRLSVDGVNGEAYLLTCLDIIRMAVGMPVGSDWQQVAERVELLGKEADWLANAAENGGCLSGEVCPRCPNGHHERKRCYGKDMRLAAHDAVMKKRRKSCKN